MIRFKQFTLLGQGWKCPSRRPTFRPMHWHIVGLAPSNLIVNGALAHKPPSPLATTQHTCETATMPTIVTCFFFNSALQHTQIRLHCNMARLALIALKANNAAAEMTAAPWHCRSRPATAIVVRRLTRVQDQTNVVTHLTHLCQRPL